MSPFVLAKVVLVLAGIGVFLLASNRDDQLLRNIAIGLVVAAFALRFVERAVRAVRGVRRSGDDDADQGPSI